MDERLTAPFFEAARRHELVIQRCADCRGWIFYPQVFCHLCHSRNLDWERVSGRGTVFSFTVVRHALHAGFASQLPLGVVLIDLDDAPGVRLVSNLVDVANEDIVIGMPVAVTFREIDGVTLPMFQRAPVVSSPK
jgi:uncharacterized OB-fold protein